MEDDNNNNIDSYIDRLEEFSKSLDLELENELLDDGVDQTEFTVIDDKSDDEDDLHINHEDLNSSFSLVDKSFLNSNRSNHDNHDNNDNKDSNSTANRFNPSSPIPKEESDDEYPFVESEKDFHLEVESEMNVIKYIYIHI